MKNALFVAWRSTDASTCRWGPVGRLDFHNGFFRFFYTRGARTLPGFSPFPGMPDLEQVYESKALFPIFANRMLPPKRPEYRDYLTWSGFNPETTPDPLAVLGVTEGRRATDKVEVFPCPEPEAGRYRSKFFLHGVRHMPEEARTLLGELRTGDSLGFMLDAANANDRQAVAVCARPPRMVSFMGIIGYLPRYAARDVATLCRLVDPGEIVLRVERVNNNAPLQQLLLCSIDAPWPSSFHPCGGDDFQPAARQVEIAAY